MQCSEIKKWNKIYYIYHFFRTIEEKLLKENKGKIQVLQSDVCWYFFRTIWKGVYESDVADNEGKENLRRINAIYWLLDTYFSYDEVSQTLKQFQEFNLKSSWVPHFTKFCAFPLSSPFLGVRRLLFLFWTHLSLVDPLFLFLDYSPSIDSPFQEWTSNWPLIHLLL